MRLALSRVFTRRLSLILIALSLPVSVFAADWKSLDRYLGLRSRAELLADMEVLVQRDPGVEQYVKQHIEFRDDAVVVFGAERKVEYVFAFQEQAPRVYRERGAKLLSGYRISIDANNLLAVNPLYFGKAQEIGRKLAEKLVARGAEVQLTAERVPMDRSHYGKIVEEVQGFQPDIALAIRFKSGGGTQADNTFVSFCTGCFMLNELKEEKDRFQFMHALVSGKIWESGKLAAHIGAKVRDLKCGVELLTDPSTFAPNACPLLKAPQVEGTCEILGFESEGQKECIPGVFVRNFFFHRVLSPVNIWLNPGHDLFKQSSDTIADAYFNGIVSYVETEFANDEMEQMVTHWQGL